MAQKGSQFRAEANPALRTVCAHCGKSKPTEVGHPHPLDAEDRGVWRETWGLRWHGERASESLSDLQ
jgi:hypothetical protein